MSHQIKNIFSSGIVNSDSDPRFLPKDQVSIAQNCDFNLRGSDGIVTSIKGTVLIEGLKQSASDIYIGHTQWKGLAYLFYSSATYNYIIELDTQDNSSSLVVQGDLNIPLNDPTFILSAKVVAGEFLWWCGGLKQSNGDILGYKEMLRVHINDAKLNPTTYSYLSPNLNRPNKLLVSSSYDPTVKLSQLRHDSFVFYSRYTNKNNEQTVLSFPSDCIDVSEGVQKDTLPNTINIAGFSVSDDIQTVEILLSNDSSNTFKIIKTIDTSISKTVAGFSFKNAYDYPVLDADPSNIINYEHPFTVTEMEVVDNTLVLGDVTTRRAFVDVNNNAISKNTPFNFVTTGLQSGLVRIKDQKNTIGNRNILVSATFVDGQKYTFKLHTYYQLIDFQGVVVWASKVHSFDWTYVSGADYASQLNFLFQNQDPAISVTSAVGDHNFTLMNASAGAPTSPNDNLAQLIIETKFESAGLNSRFLYKAGVVFMDDSGRHSGVSNITNIEHTGGEYTFSLSTQLTGIVTPPKWATKYMIVRDKVNVDLSYSLVGPSRVSALKPTFNKYRIATDYYTDYISSFRGKKIIVYSESLKRDIEVEVLSLEQREAEDAADTVDLVASSEYIYLSEDLNILENSLILFRPNKEIESVKEVFYETSAVFDINNGVFQGDNVLLNIYDTKIGTSESPFDTDVSVLYIIMLTDSEKLREINHLGRGAYTYQDEVSMSEQATLLHGQKYDPSINYNGLNVFSSYFNNYRDLTLKYGRIEKLHFRDTNLLIGQERKWSTLYIGKSMVTSSNGEESLTVSNNFFGSLRALNGEFGITDKRSFAVNGFRVYGVDRNNTSILRVSIDGHTVINGTRNNEIRESLQLQNKIDRIVGGYNQAMDKYISVFQSTADVYSFSESSKSQSSTPSFPGAVLDFISVDDKFYSVSALGDLHKHNIGPANSIQDSVAVTKVQISSTEIPSTIKDYLSISLESNLPMDVTIETLNNRTVIPKERFLKREDVWYADIPKDEAKAKIFGVGTVESESGSSITLKSNPNKLRNKDKIFSGSTEIGTLESNSGKTLIINPLINTVSVGDKLHTQRPNLIEGESIKGQYALITLESTEHIELFAVHLEVNISSNN